MKLKVRSILLFTFILFLFTFLISYSSIPREICVIKGKDYLIDINSPFNVTVSDSSAIETGKSFNFQKPLEITANEKGIYNIDFDLMGIFPVKSNVKVLDNLLVYPSGESCGVKIISDGVLVISVTNVNDGIGNLLAPARVSGILPGDFITGVNGKKIKNSKGFIKEVRTNGNKPIRLEYKRNNVTKSTVVNPVKSVSGEYVLGIWVRDSTAGLGTLTFYTGDKKHFAALGHSITDTDTGEIIPVKEGTLVKTKIISAKKGEKGTPGELIGIFEEPEIKIGKVKSNLPTGIYGLTDADDFDFNSKPLPIGTRNDITSGKAKIITTLKNNIPEEFEIEISNIDFHNRKETKNFIIKVTDEKLLSETGGIIQGMSGTPIIQNGKLVGAVTHVFVNDPTRGYGIFIENMLAEAEKIK